MADEQYEWLDKDAAERLLRREPVDPVGGHPCTEAQGLAAALDAVARAARPATGELPGEEAAVAAFRAATHAARTTAGAAHQQRNGYAGTTGEQTPTDVRASAPTDAFTPAPADAFTSAPADVLEPVHIRPASGGFAPSRSSSSSSAGPVRTRSLSRRRSRPVRFGLVASFAGCALGGVAVAASTGVLPGPFGGHAPVPATSVSAAATPEGLGSDDGSGESPSAERPAAPRTEPATPHDGASSPTGGRAGDTAGQGTDREGVGDRTPDSTERGSSNGTEYGPSSGATDGTSGNWYAKALKACRDYRNGKLDDERRTYLETLAKGARNLDRFCDRVIAKDTNGQNSPGNGNGNSNGDDGGSDEQGDDDSEENGGGALPPIWFTTSPSASPSSSAWVASPTADGTGGAGSPG
ncbi:MULTISPECIES: hypothetical protein [unclassified Streptomyces]|uniref:hypothetical protein n=1 Tax=unclassified Streptomyces TaxID=2593676 RepID=UPI0036E8646D